MMLTSSICSTLTVLFKTGKCCCRVLLLMILTMLTPAHGDEPPLVVGLIAPVSGDLAQYGAAVVNGMRLADEQVGGRAIKLIIEDNAKCDSPGAVGALRKLMVVDGIKVMVTVCTAAAQGILPVVKARGIPLIQLTEAGPDPYNFMLKLMPDSTRMATLHGELYAERYGRIAIIGTEISVNVGERGNLSSVTKGVESNGGKVVFSELLPAETTDFRPIIQKLRRSDARAVAPFIGSANAMALFLRQADELKLWSDKKLAGNFFFEFMLGELSRLYPHVLKLEGLESVNIHQTTETTFARRYADRFGSEPPQFADYGYDTVSILKACGIDIRCHRLERDGVSGKLIFNEQGRRAGSFDIRELRKGRFVTINQVM
jgi:branched-chain amino acid transport system substrate-binding protein